MNDNILEVIKISRLIIEEHNMKILSVSKKYNLSFGEADMLLIFSNNPNVINAKDVVCLSNVSKAYVSKSLNQLVDKKLITVCVDEKDKRKQKVIVNDSAKDIVKELNKVENNYLNILKKNISKESIDTLINVFYKVKDNIIEMKGKDYDKNI